jgi:Ca2+-transporting ATPase
MIITDDNFSTIVRAVSHGRALYDNLLKYIRFQMAALIGYLAMFILAGVLSIAGGIPLGPLALLWVNFANDVPIAAALGFDKETPGLMGRKPRRISAPVLTRTQWIRITITGLLSAVLALAARVIGEDSYTDAIGATMLLVTVSLAHIVIALSVRDEFGTIFSRDSLPGGRQMRLYGLTLLLIVLVTELGFLQRIVDTVELSTNQWLICLGLALVLLAYEETAKFVLRRGHKAEAVAVSNVESIQPIREPQDLAA